MLKIAIVLFREFLEISILLSIILAVTKKVENSRICVIAGVMIGVIMSSLLAFATKTISGLFGGMGDEIFDSVIILITVAVIGWTVVWMQGYSGKIKQEFDNLSMQVNSGNAGYLTLILVVAVTILREGTEIILYIYSIASVEVIDIDDYLLGGGIGAISGVMFGTVIYWGLMNLADRYIFRISSFLLLIIAAGLASEAAGILTSSGNIPALSDQVWDSSWLVEDNSVVGRILNAITGYNAKPNGMQLVFYLTTIFVVGIAMWFKSILLPKHK